MGVTRAQPGTHAPPTNHLVAFHDEPAFLAAAAAETLGAALATGAAVGVIATAPHRRAIAAALCAEGFDLDRLGDADRYVEVDADSALTTLRPVGQLDPARFDSFVLDLLGRLRSSGDGVCLYGELVALLWADGDVEAALELEDHWNRLIAQGPDFTLLCGYPMGAFADDGSAVTFREVTQRHAGVMLRQYEGVVPADDARRRGVLWRASR